MKCLKYSLYPPFGLDEARSGSRLIVLSLLLKAHAMFKHSILLNVSRLVRFNRITLEKRTKRSKNGS